jgi:hypothetical protein
MLVYLFVSDLGVHRIASPKVPNGRRGRIKQSRFAGLKDITIISYGSSSEEREPSEADHNSSNIKPMYPVRKADVPNDGLLSGCLPRFDCADAYSLPISDDKHLDFRVSVRGEGPPGERQVLVETVVCFNTWFGRLYLALVRPFHRVIVPAIMRRSFGLDRDSHKQRGSG